MAKRLLALVLPTKRKCDNCKHFDLAEGQRTFDAFPAFKAAASIIPPDRMGRAVESVEVEIGADTAAATAEVPLDERATPAETPRSKSDAPKAAQPAQPALPKGVRPKWDEFGACHHHQDIRWNGSSCREWS